MLKLIKLLVIINLVLTKTIAISTNNNNNNDKDNYDSDKELTAFDNGDNDDDHSLELPDFEFTNEKTENAQTGDDDYDEEQSAPSDAVASSSSLDDLDMDEEELDGGEHDFDVNFEDEEPLEDFQTKEQKLKRIMLKATSHPDLKRKFAEVLPLLRVMSSQQRATLASLITAQVNAKHGKELTMDQVNKMFGNRPDLILPLILDIANLIRMAALKEQQSPQSDKYSEHERLPTVQLLRRSFNIERRTGTPAADAPINEQSADTIDESDKEDADESTGVLAEQMQPQEDEAETPAADHEAGDSDSHERNGVGTIEVVAPVNNLQDDRIEENEDEPKIIENESQAQTQSASQSRSLASNLQPVFEKLVQSLPSSFHLHQQQLHTAKKLRNRAHQQQPLQQSKSYQSHHDSAPDDTMTYHESKLNMTAFNGTQKDQIAMPSDGPIPVTLPRSDTHLYRNGNDNSHFQLNDHQNLTMEEIEDLALSSLNGTDLGEEKVSFDETQPPPGSPVNNSLLPSAEMLIGGRYRKGYGYLKNKIEDTCDTFAGGICLHVDNYPVDQIMGSIRRHKHAMAALLAEYRDKVAELENNDYLEELEYSRKRKREDSPTTAAAPGGMCPSIIRYARPQKARSASGDWKYIVNTGHHTQTLRLEKCSNPQDSCTYLTDNFRSRCIQIYNYHRLLSWDSSRGLHVDIFKVPTCCSCHIDGYRETFPPLAPSYSDYNEEYAQSASTLKHNTKSHYSTLNLEDLEDDDEPDDSIAYQYSNGFKLQTKPFKYEHMLQQSPSIKKNRFERPKAGKVPIYIPQPLLETYLSPPPNDFHANYPFKRGPQITTIESAPTRIRRPLRKSTTTSDQNSSGSDLQPNRVTILPPSSFEFSTPRVSVKVTTRKPKLTTTTKNAGLRVPTLDLGKRVNYNYHPIIDFFEEENNGRLVDSIDRIGLNNDQKRKSSNSNNSNNNWKPLMNPRSQQH